MNTFPVENDPVPEGFKGWLIFLDELNSASLSVQAAAYKLILDRMIGEFNLHSRVYMVAAGNLATDKAIVNRMSTAMQSRMAHLELQLDHNSWYTWAETNDIDHRIISYLRFKPDALYSFNPNHDDYTYASPRTWEFCNRLIKDQPIDADTIPLMASVINEGQARQFKGFTDIYEDLPTKAQILSDPKGINISNEPSMLFAVSGFIKTFVNKDNFDKCMDYIERLPPEFQVIAAKPLFQENPELITTDRGINWQKTFSKEFL